MIGNILFDLDGLMVDSEHAAYEVLSSIYRKYGYELTLKDYARIIGLNTEGYRRVMDEIFPDHELNMKCDSEFEEPFHKILDEGRIPAKPGLKELVDYCDRNGIKCAVVSSSGLPRILKSLEGTGVLGSISAIVNGQEVTHGKPHPEPFLRGAEKLGVRPDECLVLEDSCAGIDSAHAAGIPVICIPDFSYPDEEHVRKCAAVLKDLSEVIGWLENNKEK